MSVMRKLNNLDWNHYGRLGVNILMNVKVLGLIGLLLFIIFGISWDTVLRPTLEKIHSQDESIEQLTKDVSSRQETQKQSAELERQLHSLTVDLLPIPVGSSSTVVALKEASDILQLAKGTVDQGGPIKALPKPHNLRENVALKPLTSSTIDLATLMGSSATANSASPPASSGSGTPLASAAAPQTVEQFDYELKVTGTYTALMDLLNALVIRKTLVKISQIDIIPSPSNTTIPDATTYPDFPFKLDMTITLSLFLYPEQSTS